MNRSARTVLIALVLVAVAALAWWLIGSGRLEQLASGGKTPAAPPAPSASAPSSNTSAPKKSAPEPITAAKDAIKDLGSRLGAPLPPAGADPAPSFDVARVEPDGEAVIAGRAVPGSAVELLVDGKVHDRTTADSSGAFVFVPKPLPPGNYDIALRATSPDGKVLTSKSAVAVALRAKDDRPVAALPAPKVPPPADKTAPAVAAVAPSPPPAAAPETAKPQVRPEGKPEAKPYTRAADLRIEAIEPEAGGGLFVSGRAAPGSRIRLYLNDGFIAMATASAEGRVSFNIQSGVRPGDYRIRLDQMSTGEGVATRVERPFRAPAVVAAPAPSKPDVASPGPAPAAPATSPQPPVVVAETPSPSASQPSVSQPSASPPAAPAPERKDVAAALAQQPAPQTTAPATQPPAPVASAPSTQPQAAAPAPAATPPAASAPAPREVAAAPSQEPVVRSTRPAPQPEFPPVAAAPQPTPQPSVPSAAATQPATTSRPIVQAPAATQPSAPSPVVSAPGSAPKADEAASPRIAGRTVDRPDAVVIPSIDTRQIVRGDNLWRISRVTYGLGQRYTLIFGANRDKIRDPDLIYPGQIFVLPRAVPKQ
jgi:nucleoid-associated protein YgaU